MSFDFAPIIPLIGGLPLGAERALNRPPKFVLSYTPFASNDQHYRNYRPDVPFYLLDRDSFDSSANRVPIIASTCPCAGLSSLSASAGSDNKHNDWMINTTRYLLEDYRPEVYYGENAPSFATNRGKGVREKMYRIARDNGYTMSVYRTKSILHGLPQVRERAFFFFWKGDRTPLLGYYKKPRPTISQLIREETSNFQTQPINPKTPSQDPLYRFILEEIHGGITHAEFSKNHMRAKGTKGDVQTYIEELGYNYEQIGAWMRDHGYDREAERCKYRHEKLATGKGIMRKGVKIPGDYIGAFVSDYPHTLTHPDLDRFITYREAMTIMGMPRDFELIGGRGNVNHICQNVPVGTATDIAAEVEAALLGKRDWIDAQFVSQYNHNQTHEEVRDRKGEIAAFFS